MRIHLVLPLIFIAACSSSSTEQTGDEDSSTSDSGIGADVGGDTSGGGPTDSGIGDVIGSDVTTDSGSIDTAPDVVFDSNTDGGPCGAGGGCGAGLTCCGDTCRNTQNDPLNCGGCGTTCSGSTSMCLGGSCAAPVCSPTCGGSQICCEIDGPGPTHFACVAGPTCPIGCPSCK